MVWYGMVNVNSAIVTKSLMRWAR